MVLGCFEEVLGVIQTCQSRTCDVVALGASTGYLTSWYLAISETSKYELGDFVDLVLGIFPVR